VFVDPHSGQPERGARQEDRFRFVVGRAYRPVEHRSRIGEPAAP